MLFFSYPLFFVPSKIYHSFLSKQGKEKRKRRKKKEFKYSKFGMVFKIKIKDELCFSLALLVPSRWAFCL